MSNDLFKGIYSYFNALPHNDFYSAIEGRLEYVRADCSWLNNYAVMQGTGFYPDDTFDAKIEDAYVQFSLFSLGRSLCGELLEKCKDLFDGSVVNVPNHHPVKLFRELQLPPYISGESDLWQAVIEFRCKIQSI